jgi:triacylglycerol lipase
MARAAQLAYSKAEDIEAIARHEWDMTQFAFFQFKETEAYAMGNGQQIILSFRGSDDMGDWFNNIDMVQVAGPCKGKAHQGFTRILDQAWGVIEQTIGNWNNAALQQGQTAPTLSFTGHSMGAAVATLAVERLHAKGQTIHSLYTFGSPRVGDSAFSKHFNQALKSRTFRFVNGNDLITRMPPRPMDYNHVGQLYYFNHKGDLQTEPSYWYRLLDRFQVRLDYLDKLKISEVDNHDIQLYVNGATRAAASPVANATGAAARSTTRMAQQQNWT